MSEAARKILVTRPQPDAERTAAGLAALGLVPVIAPMLVAKYSTAPLPDASRFAAIAVTSANAVRALAARPEAETFAHLPVYAVGDQTAAEARATGFDRVSSAKGTLHDLAATLAAERPPGTILYPAAHHQSGDLAGLLADAGMEVVTHVLYAMEPAADFPPDVSAELSRGAIEGAVFYSRRTAQIFSELAADMALGRRLHCLCLSENVAEPLLENHFVHIGLADYPSNEAMMTLALAFARDQISP